MNPPRTSSPAHPPHASGRAPAPPAMPRVRVAAAIILALEALALAAAASYSFLVVAEDSALSRFGTGLGLFILLFAAAVGLAARSVMNKGRFGVGFGITWQLFQALVGASLLSGGLILPGLFAIASSIAVFVLLTMIVRATPLPYDVEDPDRTSR